MSAQQYELKGHRLCGNCWVEGWPAGARPRSLDGLRLRLDLRVEALDATETELDARAQRAAATATEPGIGPARGLTQRIASRALSIPRSVQALSVAAGLGVVLVALAIWNSATPPQGSPTFPVPATSSSLAALSSPALSSPAVVRAPSSDDAGVSRTQATAHLAPNPAAGTALAATPPVQSCPEPSLERRTAESTPGALARPRVRSRASLDGTPQHPILASTRRETSAAASSAEADLMYLFSDIR